MSRLPTEALVCVRETKRAAYKSGTGVFNNTHQSKRRLSTKKKVWVPLVKVSGEMFTAHADQGEGAVQDFDTYKRYTDV